MSRFLDFKSEKVGMAPGTVVHVGEILDEKVTIRVFKYNENHFEETVVKIPDNHQNPHTHENPHHKENNANNENNNNKENPQSKKKSRDKKKKNRYKENRDANHKNPDNANTDDKGNEDNKDNTCINLDDILLSNESLIMWIDVDGIHRPEIVEKIGNKFNLHPLTMEDIVHVGNRPKLEDYDKYLFIVIQMIYYDEKKEEVHNEGVSLVVGDNFVLSFQEGIDGDCMEPVRQRLRNGGRLRKTGADFLAYSLIDIIVDNYFTALENIGDYIEDLEGDLVENPKGEDIETIHTLKRELLFFRKSVWPLREVISGLQRYESALIKPATGVYLRDLYDHTIQIIDTIETFRDMTSGLLDIYLSSINNKMSEVMKVLTIIATIFIPLTFIVGVYGMNFEYMPELKWEWGYFCTLGIMASISIGMLIYFKIKKWL